MTLNLPTLISRKISGSRLFGVLSVGALVAGATLVYEGSALRSGGSAEVGSQTEANGGLSHDAASPFSNSSTVLTNSTALYASGFEGQASADETLAWGEKPWIERLHALSNFGGPDSDADGLPDAFEQVMQSDLDGRDTDSDGFEDFEERARGTNVHDATDFPTGPDVAKLDLISHATADDLMVGMTMYFGSGLNGRYKARIGVSSGGRIALLPLSYLGDVSQISDVTRITVATGPGYEPSADLRFMELRLPRRLIDGGRHLCVFAYLVDTVTAQIVEVEKLDLFSTMDGGIVAEQTIDSLPPATGGTQVPTSGSIYIPLGGGNGPADVPVTWKPLRVCLKSSTVVGTSGSLVTREVVRASCVAGYDGYCPSTCPSSVGSTYQTIDPLTFVSE